MQRSLLRSVVVIFCVLGSTCTLSGQSSFVRGDCNRDGANDIADAIALLGFLFGGGGTPLACESACDGNDDGGVDIADAIAVLGSLFGSPVVPLTAPTTCGPDPTPDSLSCLDFPACAPVGAGLTEVRNAPDGPVDLFVAGVRVTVLRPPLGGFPGSFYVQEGPTGPAVWIAVDPLSLTPSPQPGDIVNLRVLELDTGSAGGRLVTQIGDWAVTGSADPDEYAQDVSLADDLVTNQTAYASELVVSTIMVTGLFTTFGAFQGAPIETAGDTSGNLRLFLPPAVSDALGLLPGDVVLVRGVVLEAPSLSTTAIAVFTPEAVRFFPSSLTDARNTVSGQTSLWIENVLVTYLRSAIDVLDHDSFHVQEGPTGAALRIDVDPQSLSPSPQIGDRVSFRITSMGGSLDVDRSATNIDLFRIESSGNDVSAFVQDVSSATDLVSNDSEYADELVHVTATLTSDSGVGGGPFANLGLATDGDVSGNLILAVHSTLYPDLGLVVGVTYQFTGVLYRGGSPSSAFIAIFHGGDVTYSPPELLSASYYESTSSIVLGFNVPIDPTSVVDPASQFAIDPPLAVVGSSVNGSVVTLTTDPPAPTTYTITVAETVYALYGGLGVSPSANSAMFTYVLCAATTTDLVINEIEYDNVGPDDAEFVEIYNPTGVPQSLGCVSLVFANGNAPLPTEYLRVDLSPAGATLGPGEFLLVKAPALAAPPGVLSVDLPSASSNIQNVGPDTVSIVVDCWLLDTVSYAGEVDDAQLIGCGFLPVGIYGFTLLEDTGPEVLVRFPDGANTDDNAVDWSLSSTPTPGLPNVP